MGLVVPDISEDLCVLIFLGQAFKVFVCV